MVSTGSCSLGHLEHLGLEKGWTFLSRSADLQNLENTWNFGDLEKPGKYLEFWSETWKNLEIWSDTWKSLGTGN